MTVTGWPVVGPPQAWRVDSLDGDWCQELTGPEVREIRAAALAAAAAGLGPTDLTRASFPLPTLAPRLAAVGRAVGHGRGFALLRGIPVDWATDREGEIVSHGLGVWLGRRLIGDGAGENPFTTHLRDVGLAQTVGGHIERRPHCDVTDWLTLLCHQRALAGGVSGLSSLATVHDVLRERDPGALATMYEPFDFGHCYACGTRLLRPGFAWSGRRFFGRTVATGRDGATATDAQRHAAALVEAIAEEPDVQLRIVLQPGDLLVVNNTAVTHARTEFVDGAPPWRRHLLRLHLEPAEAPGLPAAFDWRCAGQWHEWSIPRGDGFTVGPRPLQPAVAE